MTDNVNVPREVIEQTLALVNDMTRFVGSMALQDYAALDAVPRNLSVALAAAPKAEPVSDPYKLGEGEVLQWVDGYPEKFRSGEWFIALTTFGDRVCLKALPEEYSYDFTTADGTYIKADKIVKWMPFPDSEYRYPAPASDELLEALERIEDMAPATCETSLAHEMAEIARAAIAKRKGPQS